MTKVIGNASQVAAWMDAIAEMNTDQVDKVPAGWISIEEFADHIGKTPQTARTYLNKLVKANRAERRKFRTMMMSGPRPMLHYKLK